SGRGDKISLKEPYGAVKKLTKVKTNDEILEINDVRNDGYSMNLRLYIQLYRHALNILEDSSP
ncbi:hypothetical protein ACTPEM_25435, partial [Clostridioides difficile]